MNGFVKARAPWSRPYGAADISIDLGTANTLVYIRGRGIVLNEPSVVAVREVAGGKQEVVAVGLEAKALVGKTPHSITTVRPIKEGVIADYDLAKEMLEHFIRRSRRPWQFGKPSIVVTLPHGVTEIEKRAVEEAGYSIGAKKIVLIKEPIAAAIGANLPVLEPVGSMLVDIGGGTTEVAILSLAGIVCCHSIRVGGDVMDEKIIEMVKRKHRLYIGEQTAEKIKIALGTAWSDGDTQRARVKGRDSVTGLPKIVEITAEEIAEAISTPLRAIVNAIKTALATTPPALAGDIVERGIIITGGGALIRNMDTRLQRETGLPIIIDKSALLSVALGGGKAIEDPELLEAISNG
ncbi:MAG: rod shape-determining protein [Candidatus Manganitrophaceae bacterium]|nr:MAG: rod shape-determining protein [Candidatus Manganitrophaceae bacterium]